MRGALDDEELLEQALDDMRERRNLKRQVQQRLSMGLDTWRALRSTMKQAVIVLFTDTLLHLHF